MSKIKKYHQNYFTKKAVDIFLEKVFELAFGDDAINKNYSMSQVVKQLEELNKLSINCKQKDCNCVKIKIINNIK